MSVANWRILHGDCLEVLATLPAESIDACVTDPPYGIGFMGREWDTFKPEAVEYQKGKARKTFTEQVTNPNLKGRIGWMAGVPVNYDYTPTGLRGFQAWTEAWGREVLRVLKPGAHILVCGAPRAYHRMACGLEDAGFEIRDCLAWLFGQGFPKSLNLGEGLGTALKPAHEPIVLARKPFKGSVRANVEQYGTGALNIDTCRIETTDELHAPQSDPAKRGGVVGSAFFYGADRDRFQNAQRESIARTMDLGRWPANVALDDLAAMVLDEQSGELISGFMSAGTEREGLGYHGGLGNTVRNDTHGDCGGASRFYYVAKPSREERDYGCGHLAARTPSECTDRKEGSAGLKNPRAGAGRIGGGRNHHPTVKPVELMRWLVKLITPPSGVVLDPFCGSGTTGMACRYEQRSFIGIEKEAEYLEIAQQRIAAVAPLFNEVGA